MKFKRAVLMMLAIACLFVQTAFAESWVSAKITDGVLRVEWSAQGECVLTIYRDNWPISVCAVDGMDGGMSCPIPGSGRYSVRLKTPDSCLTAEAQTANPTEVPSEKPTEHPTEAPTQIPTLAPTEQPTLVPTFTPTVMPTHRPTLAPTVIPTARPTAVPTANPGGQTMTGLAAQVVGEVNAERAKYGLSPLTVDARLTGAACVRAQEIVESFSHTRPDGTSWSTVSSAAYGENIAKGHNSADRVMAAWMSSDGHRKNILRESFGSIGVCALEVNGVIYWVQLFGK